MHEAGDEPLKELPLAEHHRGLRLRPAPELAGPVGRPPEADDPVEEVRAPREQAPGDREHGDEDDRGGERAHPERAARIAAPIAGTTSCRSPITA